MTLRLRSATLRANGTRPFVLSVAAPAAESKHTGMNRYHVESVLEITDRKAFRISVRLGRVEDLTQNRVLGVGRPMRGIAQLLRNLVTLRREVDLLGDLLVVSNLGFTPHRYQKKSL